MGAWGCQSFENDDASDWIYGLASENTGDPFSYPRTRIRTFLEIDGYLDSFDACEAIAAAECIAYAIGRGIQNPPEDLEQWANGLQGAEPDPDLVSDAIRAVKTIISSDQSELLELWSESSSENTPDPEWMRAIDDLLRRLGAEL